MAPNSFIVINDEPSSLSTAVLTRPLALDFTDWTSAHQVTTGILTATTSTSENLVDSLSKETGLENEERRWKTLSDSSETTPSSQRKPQSKVIRKESIAVVLTEALPVSLAEVEFSEQVKRIRMLFGFSNAEFSRLLGVPESQILSWERGASETPPQYEQTAISLERLAILIGSLWNPNKLHIWVHTNRKELNNVSPWKAMRRKGGLFYLLDRFSVYA